MGDVMSDRTNNNFVADPRVLQAQRVLYKLGYSCASIPLDKPGDPDAWIHSIYNINTEKLVLASIHSDIFETTAIAKTFTMLSEKAG